MNNEWAAIFDGRPKQKLVEDKPYRCVICKTDQRRYAKAADYARHMKVAHSFHSWVSFCGFPMKNDAKEYSVG